MESDADYDSSGSSQPRSPLAVWVSSRAGFWTLMVVGGFIGVGLFVFSRAQAPPPQSYSYHIFSGEVARAIIREKSSNVGKTMIPFQPQSLWLESTAGPVDLYVVPYSTNAGRDGIQQMLSHINTLKAGKKLEGALFQQTGKVIEVRLHNWPRGWKKYLVYIHSAQDTDVELKVRYY